MLNTSSSVSRRTKASKALESNCAAISAERVQQMLRQAAFLMHTTRVVGWKGGFAAPKKG